MLSSRKKQETDIWGLANIPFKAPNGTVRMGILYMVLGSQVFTWDQVAHDLNVPGVNKLVSTVTFQPQVNQLSTTSLFVACFFFVGFLVFWFCSVLLGVCKKHSLSLPYQE